MDRLKILLEYRFRSAGICGKIDNCIFQTLCLFNEFCRHDDIITFHVKENDKKLILGRDGDISGPLLIIEDEFVPEFVPEIDLATLYLIYQNLSSTEFYINGEIEKILYHLIFKLSAFHEKFIIRANRLGNRSVHVKIEIDKKQ
jgi:hypothetical protein